MKAIIKVFDDKEYLNNVIVPLSIDVDTVVYIYHHKQDKNLLKNNDHVLKKYRSFNTFYHELKNDEEEIENILKQHQEIIVDISSNRYLTMLLFEKALRYGHKIVYYDGDENVIKDYRRHEIIIDKVFSLTIKDILRLSGGIIKHHMHDEPDTNDEKTDKIITSIVNEHLDDYSSFIAYVQKVNHLIRKNENGSFYLSDKDIEKIKTDPMYGQTSKYHLFTINNNKLSFLNKMMENLFRVSGTWLEAYLYLELKKSNKYDEVIMSAMIDFADRNNDNYPVACEVDGMVLKNNHLCFISIKSNKVETDALNEIKTHQERFGNRLSRPVICTLDKLSEDNPSIYLKAQSLKIAVIENIHFKNKSIYKILNKIFDNTYTYLNRL